MKTTSLDYAILGLIHQKPLSGYGIRKEFETTALGNYSSSPGSIYPALDRLQKLELITKVLSQDKKKTRFECTNLALEVLKTWFLKPLDKKDITHKLHDVLLRFAFMENILDNAQKLDFLSSLQVLVKNYLIELQAFQNNEEFQQLPLHGRLAFTHGIDSYQTTLKWCRKTISILNNHE